MIDDNSSREVAVSAETAFTSWSDFTDLPHYFPRLPEVIDHDVCGSDGCLFAVRLRSTNADSDRVRAGLDAAVEATQQRLESD